VKYDLLFRLLKTVFSLFDERDSYEIFGQSSSFSPTDAQNTYLQNLIELKDVKHRHPQT
jgi:hypothetical protein